MLVFESIDFTVSVEWQNYRFAIHKCPLVADGGVRNLTRKKMIQKPATKRTLPVTDLWFVVIF
jgi:hypothetical protein